MRTAGESINAVLRQERGKLPVSETELARAGQIRAARQLGRHHVRRMHPEAPHRGRVAEGGSVLQERAGLHLHLVEEAAPEGPAAQQLAERPYPLVAVDR